MAGEFGKHHRNLVADANAGNITPAPSQTAQVNVPSAVTSEQRFEDTSRTESSVIAQSLIKAAGTVAVGISAIADQRNEITQFNEAAGLQGEQSFDQSIASEYFTGKNTSREVKQAALADEVQAFTNGELKTLGDFQSTDTAEYQGGLKDRYMQMAEQHKGDAETQALLLNAYKKNAGPLMAQQAKANAEFLQTTATNQWAQTSMRNLDTMNRISGDVFQEAEAVGSTETHFLTKPTHVTPAGHTTLQVGSIIDSLNKGDNTYLTIAKDNGLLFSPTQQKQIDSATWTYTKRHSDDYREGIADLTQSLASLDIDGSADQIDILQQQYPQWNSEPYLKQLATKEARAQKLETDHKARVSQVNTQGVMSGTKPQQRAAYDEWMDNAIENTMLSASDDPTEGVTPEQTQNFLINHTDKYVKQWSKANVSSSAVQSLTQGITNILGRDFEQIGDRDQLIPQLSAFKELNAANPKLAARQFASTQDYDVAVAALSTLAYGEGNVSDIKRAADNARANAGTKGMPTGKASREVSDSIAENIIEGMDGYWEMQDNTAQGSLRMKERAFDIYMSEIQSNGGNTVDAEKQTKSRLSSEFAKVHDKFFGGANALAEDLERSGVTTSLPDVVSILNGNDEFMNSLTETHGLDPDRDFMDNDGHSMSYSPIGGLMIHGVRKDGTKTTVSVNLPTQDKLDEMNYANDVRDKSGAMKFLTKLSLWNDLAGMPDYAASNIVYEAEKFGNLLGLTNLELAQLQAHAGMAEPEQPPSNMSFASPSPEVFSEDTLSQPPLTQKQLQGNPNFFTGNSAISQVEAKEGELTDLMKAVISSEGYVSVPYLDSKGIPTIGVGQTKEYMGKTFKETFAAHKQDADRILAQAGVGDINTQAQDIVREMVFQMGAGAVNKNKWPSMFKALRDGDYASAADHMLDSKWAREDTPSRANRLAEKMRNIN